MGEYRVWSGAELGCSWVRFLGFGARLWGVSLQDYRHRAELGNSCKGE